METPNNENSTEYDITPFIPEELTHIVEDLGISSIIAKGKVEDVEPDCELVAICEGISTRFYLDCTGNDETEDDETSIRTETNSDKAEDDEIACNMSQDVAHVLGVIKNEIDGHRMEF